MEYVVVGICIVVVALIVALLIYRRKMMSTPEGENKFDQDSGAIIAKQISELSHSDQKIDELIIPMEMLPAEEISDESKLVEITDSKVLAHVNNLVPGLAQASVAGLNAVQAAKAGNEVLYRAIIPAGAKLTNSRATEGAVRGFYQGAGGIQGHADLVAVQAQKGTAVVANTAAAAMGVASMVVGQYYMTQINAEIDEISDGISKITDFQDNEFRSRVFSLVAHVKKITDFQVEILDNDELRLSKIAQLDSMEEQCTQLLGQVNLTLADFAKKNNLDYASYEKELKGAQNWYAYQKTLLDVLYKISDLRYTLHMGTVSREQCIALLQTFVKQVIIRLMGISIMLCRRWRAFGGRMVWRALITLIRKRSNGSPSSACRILLRRPILNGRLQKPQRKRKPISLRLSFLPMMRANAFSVCISDPMMMSLLLSHLCISIWRARGMLWILRTSACIMKFISAMPGGSLLRS